MQLRLYQSFHNKETYEHCSKSPEIIKIYTGCKPEELIGSQGDFIIANEGKFAMDSLCDFNAIQYIYNHIADAEHIGLIHYCHNFKCLTKIKPEDILKLNLEEIFKDGTQFITFHPWNNVIDHTDKRCPGMNDLMIRWMKEEFRLTDLNIEEILKLGREKILTYRNIFITPVNEFKGLFIFMLQFYEYIDKNYDIRNFNVDIPLPHKWKGWSYFIERLFNFYFLNKYRNNIKFKAF